MQERTNTINLGGCDGILPSHIPRALKLKVGDVIYIRPATEPDGSSAFPIPEAVGHALKRTAVRGAIAQYQAAHAGNAVLVARDTPFCEAHNPQEGTCRILTIEVRPRS